MKNETPPISGWQRLIQKAAASRLAAWFLARWLPGIDRALLRLSGNQFNLSTALSGIPVVVLTTTGAKSGLPRETPLFAIFDEGKAVLIATSFGNTHHPAWYHNLVAHPEATLTLNGTSTGYTARPANPAERERYWAQALRLYSGYRVYEAARRRTGDPDPGADAGAELTHCTDLDDRRLGFASLCQHRPFALEMQRTRPEAFFLTGKRAKNGTTQNLENPQRVSFCPAGSRHIHRQLQHPIHAIGTQLNGVIKNRLGRHLVFIGPAARAQGKGRAVFV